MTDTEQTDNKKEEGPAPAQSTDARKAPNLVSIHVLGKAIASVGKGGLPNQIDLDALVKEVQRYNQGEGGEPMLTVPGTSTALPESNTNRRPDAQETVHAAQSLQGVQHGPTGAFVPPMATQNVTQQGGLLTAAHPQSHIVPRVAPIRTTMVPRVMSGNQHPMLSNPQPHKWTPEELQLMAGLASPLNNRMTAGRLVAGGAMLPADGHALGHVGLQQQPGLTAPRVHDAQGAPIMATAAWKPATEHASRPVSRRGPQSKSSPYRGVSCYKRTGRWEAHIWHAGRQVHLGTYSTPEEAARVYDTAAIKLRGWGADLNFDVSLYKDDPELKDCPLQLDKSSEEADISKLVKGLKRRKGSGAKGGRTKGMKTEHHMAPPSTTTVAIPPGYPHLAAESGLPAAGTPRGISGTMYFRHPSDPSIVIPHASPRIPIDASTGRCMSVDANQMNAFVHGGGSGGLPPQSQRWFVREGAEPGQPVLLQDRQPSGIVQSRDPQGGWVSGPGAVDPNLGIAGAHVTPSRVVSLARSPTFRHPGIQPSVVQTTGSNGQAVWTSVLPASSGMRVVVDGKSSGGGGVVRPGEFNILEGKPVQNSPHHHHLPQQLHHHQQQQQQQGVGTPRISAYWPHPGGLVPPSGPTNVERLNGGDGAGLGGVRHQNGFVTERNVVCRGRDAGNGNAMAAPLSLGSAGGSLQAVLQEVAAGQDGRGIMGPPASVPPPPSEANIGNPDHHQSVSVSRGPVSGPSPAHPPAGSAPPPPVLNESMDPKERFAKLLQLIHELPVHQIVKPRNVVKSEEGCPSKDKAGSGNEGGGGGDKQDEDNQGTKRFADVAEGGQELRPVKSKRSAFKTWTSSDSGGGKLSDDGQGSTPRGPGSTVASGQVHETQAAETAANGSQDNVQENGDGGDSGGQVGNDNDECEKKTVDACNDGAPGKECKQADDGGGATSGKKGGDSKMMEDDLLAAQQLCELSQMVGHGSSNGTSTAAGGGSAGGGDKKRQRSPSPPSKGQLPAWQIKKQRTVQCRQGRKDFSGVGPSSQEVGNGEGEFVDSKRVGSVSEKMEHSDARNLGRGSHATDCEGKMCDKECEVDMGESLAVVVQDVVMEPNQRKDSEKKTVELVGQSFSCAEGDSPCQSSPVEVDTELQDATIWEESLPEAREPTGSNNPALLISETECSPALSSMKMGILQE